ncbi:hypothetical protein MMSR116_29320 [Methylobacterium mesophilicum SR1.6/6]|uniref:Uncharacterized protein n=1 Tax=Methylobacterium mesophilicum SR1.6/6 TaxID=908290 RepID=A0A6B9FSY3_9HYPH|nr:hypothetical protein [Methylobacterium mesophilicum]QGY05537.1 hypothetical protein MMSR116_29320 [Methylobacterium mesophilicum SR1.6/6]
MQKIDLIGGLKRFRGIVAHGSIYFLYSISAQISIMAKAQAENPEIIANPENRASTLLLGYGGEDWDRWLILAVMFAAVAAIAVGFTTAGSIITHKREAEAAQKDLERYKIIVEGKVADAHKEGIEAGRSATDALARASEADAKAAEAQLKLEELRSKLGPRQIDQLSFANFLITGPKQLVYISYLRDDPECGFLAEQIYGGLKAADWPVQRPSPLSAETSKLYAGWPKVDTDYMPLAALAGGQPGGVTIAAPLAAAMSVRNYRLKDTPSTALTNLFRALISALGSIAVTTDDTLPNETMRIIIAPRKPHP